jgi:alpha-L-fucosidase 2
MRPDLTLWYGEPAGADWLRALPVGNGRLGAMVFGNPDTETLQLNEDTVWAGGPCDSANRDGPAVLPDARRLIFAGRWREAQDLLDESFLGHPVRQLPYQTVGNLRLAFPDGPTRTHYRRELDLTNATATVSYVAGGIRYRREVIASVPDQVIAVRLTADSPGAVTFTATFDSPQRTRVSSPDGATVALAGVSGDGPDGILGSVRFLALVRALADGGVMTSAAGRLSVTGADAVTLLVSIGTSYVDYTNASGDPAAVAWSHLRAATGTAYGELRRRHVADHRRLFDRVDLDLGHTDAAGQPTDVRVARHAGDDPHLATLLFQYGRYLLISSSRPGTQPANLQGIWTDLLDPPWGCRYTININLPMNYWPAGPANLPECFAPVRDLVRELAVSGARTARVQYGAGGWVTHHNTDGWRGSSVADGAVWGMWQTGGAWLAVLVWEHYLFTGDVEALRDSYPAMRGAAQFFLDTLVPEPDHGWLVTSPSNSPEQEHHPGVSVCAGPTMDMQILRDLFDACVAAGEILGLDAELRDRLLSTRDRLAPARGGARGHGQEWLHDWVEVEPGHRHISHLYGLHPSNQITRRGTPELFEAARRTLELRGDAGTGWSLAWKINFWARMEEPQRAHDLLRALIVPDRLAPNLFDLHPPFQIDGNFGATAGIAEMLLHSHAGELHLLPALPAAWPDGHFDGLRARGGYTVGATWRDGRATELRITADHTGPVRVRSRMFTNRYEVIDATAGTRLASAAVDPGVGAVALPAEAGHTYRLTMIPDS